MKIGYVIFALYIISIIYIHYRGKVKFPALRQMMTHTNFIAPYNGLIYVFSDVPNKPILTTQEFPELKVLRENWEIIRDESLALAKSGHINVSTGTNDLAFNSFFRTGWKRFYLKWYDDFLPSAQTHCPKTVELLKNTPNINAAMFASLPPGARLSAHRDPYAGSLRYHLGLKTPNAENCLINIDGESYSWRDGEDILFDETYIHFAENNSQDQRIILFCDIQRPLKIKLLDKLSRFISQHIIKASATQNTHGEQVGVLNKIFGQFYILRLVAKRIKKWNKPVYKTAKFSLFFLFVYWLFF